MKRLLLSSVTTEYILVMHAYTDGEGEQFGCTNQRSRLTPTISEVKEALSSGDQETRKWGHTVCGHTHSLHSLQYQCEGPNALYDNGKIT